MRILWSSNSPFVATGYGTQTATAARRLNDMGHNVAILAFFGLQGSRIEWGDIPIYPNPPQDWGVGYSPMFYEDWNADILITLVDIWVLNKMDPELKWCPWFPVDHDPIPPAVLTVLKKSPGIVKPIAMSKFGQKQAKDNGIETYYIPHSVNSQLYHPDLEWRKYSRGLYEWEDKFVVGCVGTNHVQRKNWVASLQAIQMFERNHPGKIVFYMHTNPQDERGIDLMGLCDKLGITDVVKVPKKADTVVGIPPETMFRMYNALDVFLLPSKGEGFGIPIVEAQACGIPVITTNCTAQPELVDGGWLIKDLQPEWTTQTSWQFNSNPEEIHDCLEQAYQSKKDGSMVERKIKARDKALEYDEEKIYSEYWPPVLADIEKRIKEPRNMEGVVSWRLPFIPQTCIPRKVLDIGCGLTQPYRPFLERLGEYVGIDVKNGNGVKRMDAHKLTFSDNEFGFVWCSELLEHVDNPKQVLAEAKRVGKHGVCLFSTPLNNYFKIDPSHKIVKGIDYSTLSTGDGCIVW